MTKQQAEALLLKYCWAVLENRWKYYVGRYNSKKVEADMISDEKYDKYEKDYKKLCHALKVKPYAVEMVGFSFDRPSTRMVNDKMCRKYGIPITATLHVGG